MADMSRDTESNPEPSDDIGVEPSISRRRMPRWLQVSLIVVAAVAVLLVVLMLKGAFGGGHG